MILLAALLLGGFLMYRWKKRKEREAELEAKREAERIAREEEEKAIRAEEERRLAEVQAQAEQRAKDVEENIIPEENLTEEEKRQRAEKQAILKFIDEKPADVAMLIKTWLSEDE